MTRLGFLSLRLVISFDDSLVKLILNHTIILIELLWLLAESLQQGM